MKGSVLSQEYSPLSPTDITGVFGPSYLIGDEASAETSELGGKVTIYQVRVLLAKGRNELHTARPWFVAAHGWAVRAVQRSRRRAVPGKQARGG